MNDWHRTRMLLVLVLLLGTLSSEGVRARQTPSSLPGATPPTSTGPGEITVQILACPAGMRPLDLEPTACSPNATAIALLLGAASAAGNRPHPVPAPHDDAVLTWSGIPFGTYSESDGVCQGYDRYLIPSRAGPQQPAGPRLYQDPTKKGISCRSMPSIPATTSMSTSSAPSRQRGRFVSACDCGSVRSALPPRPRCAISAVSPSTCAPPNFALEISGQDRAFWAGWAATDSGGFLTWGDVPRGGSAEGPVGSRNERICGPLPRFRDPAPGVVRPIRLCPRPGARNRNTATGDRGGRDRCLPLALRVNHTAMGLFFVFEPVSTLGRQPAAGATHRGQAPHLRRWYLPTTAVLRPVGPSP